MRQCLLRLIICTTFPYFSWAQVLLGYDSYKLDIGTGRSDGTKNGLWKYYYDPECKLLKAEVNYKNDTLQGEFRTYYTNGKLKAAVCFVRGLKEGKATFYYEKGLLWIETYYHNDSLQGQFKEFYPNGRTKRLLNLSNNWLHGKAYAYYNDRKGTLHAEGEFNNGERHGTYSLYDKQNKTQEFFNHNSPNGNRVTYDKKGILVYEMVYEVEQERYVKSIQYKGGVLHKVFPIGPNEPMAHEFIYGNWLIFRRDFY